VDTVLATLREYVSRLRGALRPRRSDLDLQEELRVHLEMAADDARRGGHSIQTAARTANLQSGVVAQAMEELRDQRGLPWLADLAQDVRYGWRGLVRNRGVSAVVVLSLALGVGANTAIFSLINTLMWRRLPVRAPEQLVELLSQYPGEPRVNGFAWKYYEHIRDRNHVFSDLIGSSPARFQVSGDGLDAESAAGEYVVGSFFPALGVQPAAGRLLGPEDDQLGGTHAAVAVVSWSFWRSRFELDPTIVGRRIRVNGVPAVVVGVGPRGFFGLQPGSRTDVWVPTAMEAMIQRPSRRATGELGLNLMGRLKPHASIQEARAEMSVLDQWRVDEIGKRSNDPALRRLKIYVEPAGAGFSLVREELSKPLLILMALVGLLLATACTNVASILLARGAARQPEMALRVSLGAGSWRLVRQVLTESWLLSWAGSLLGVFLAYFGVGALVRVLASGRPLVGLPGPMEIQVQADVHVLLFTAGVASLTGMLFGLAPAWQASSLGSAWPRARGGVRGPKARRMFGKGLVVAQVGLSVVLLSAAGLFVRHLSTLRDLNLGFQREAVLLVTLHPHDSGYDRPRLLESYRELLGRLEAAPGVRSATVCAITPISGAGEGRLARLEGFQERPGDRRYLAVNRVGPKYFETFGTPLVAGRDFTFQDAGRPPVAIVNQAVARHYFHDGSPLGRRVAFDGEAQSYEIVGVVGDAKYADLHEPVPHTIYLDAFQGGSVPWRLAIRTSVPPTAVAGDVRRAVREVLRVVRVDGVTTLANQVDASIVPERLIAMLSGLFGGLGATLAAIGLYGALAYGVARRTNEIGTRIALGATQRDIAQMVLKRATGMVSAGLLVGAPVAMWSLRLAAVMIPSRQAGTGFPVAFAVVAIVGVALLASYVPARRAARVQPMDALRHD
jgi:putative ABC transport system permease protein